MDAAVNSAGAVEGDVLKGRDILELPVYTISEGKLLGNIDGLMVKRETQSVPVIRVKSGTLGGHRFIAFANMQTVGVDIALVPSEAQVLSALSPEDSQSLDLDLRGRNVLTPTGQQVGTLAGFEMDTATGKIVTFRVKATAGFFSGLVASVRDDTTAVSASHVHSIGPDAIILDATGAAQFGDNAQAAAPSPAAVGQAG